LKLEMSGPEKVNFRAFFPRLSLFSGRRSTKNVATSLYKASNTKSFIQDNEVARFRGVISEYARKSPRTSLILAGLGGASLLLGVFKGLEAAQANAEISFRKDQLEKPIFELKGNDAVNFPWGKENLREWLYRPIRITGRPLHNKAMLIPRRHEGYRGFDYIVPLVTKENEDGSVQEGILLNKGWIPHEYAHVGARHRIENARPQTFDCYLSLQSELDEKGSLFKEGNSPARDRNKWNHVFLPDMAKASGFKNVDSVKLALLERVNLKTLNDERNPKHFEYSLAMMEDYPFEKTKAGALQLRHMPWDLQAHQNAYSALELSLALWL